MARADALLPFTLLMVGFGLGGLLLWLLGSATIFAPMMTFGSATSAQPSDSSPTYS